MPTFEITAPNGKTYEVTGKSAEGAYAALRKSLAGVDPVDEIDTPLEYAKDIGGAALAGAGRGLIGTLELPEMALRGDLKFTGASYFSPSPKLIPIALV
jgi:hypothetical protein